MRVEQHQILGNELNIGNPALVGFDIKAIAVFITQVRAHFLAHLAHFRLQRTALARGGHHILTDGIELRFELRIAIHHAGAHQRLMLPRPGFVLLIVGKSLRGGNQHACRAGRAQTRIHFIQNAG